MCIYILSVYLYLSIGVVYRYIGREKARVASGSAAMSATGHTTRLRRVADADAYIIDIIDARSVLSSMGWEEWAEGSLSLLVCDMCMCYSSICICMYVKIRRHQHTRVHAHTGPRRHASMPEELRRVTDTTSHGLYAGRHYSTQTTIYHIDIGRPGLCDRTKGGEGGGGGGGAARIFLGLELEPAARLGL